MNPGPPAPQAGILDQSRRNLTKIPDKSDSLTRRRPQHEELIINTLISLTNNGKSENTIKTVSHILTQIGRNTDLTQPEKVKAYIATATKTNGHALLNSTKTKYTFCYDCFCKTQNIEWTPPRFKWTETIPIIPTTENITKIISSATKRYATIFTLLAEIGLSGQELHKLPRNQIDLEQGIISVSGYKGHASATYKLKTRTLEMLREYLAKNPEEYPFPRPKIMSQIWQRTRNKVADNLKQQELKNIPMKNLRNYSGAKLYQSIPDPILVMRHLRHKKLETTMHYIRGITLDGEEEYLSKGATNAEEAKQLIEAGFQYVCTTPQNIMLFRKRK